MSDNNHKNKCKGQMYTGHSANAAWFDIRVARGRKRNRLAYKSLRKNRMRNG